MDCLVRRHLVRLALAALFLVATRLPVHACCPGLDAYHAGVVYAKFVAGTTRARVDEVAAEEGATVTRLLIDTPSGPIYQLSVTAGDELDCSGRLTLHIEVIYAEVSHAACIPEDLECACCPSGLICPSHPGACRATVLYGSEDRSAIVRPGNEIEPMTTEPYGPINYTPLPVFLQADDGTGYPAVIYVTKDQFMPHLHAWIMF